MNWVQVKYLQEEEKTAALDEAIDWEDACPPRDEPAPPNRLPTIDDRLLRKGLPMIRTDLLIELDGAVSALRKAEEAATALRKAEEDFRAACRRIADQPATDTLVPAVGLAAPAAEVKAMPRGRGRAGGNRKPGSTPGKVRFMPQVKIKCAKCGTIVEGAKEKDGAKYPYRHRNKLTGTVCQGQDLVGSVVEAHGDSGQNPE